MAGFAQTIIIGNVGRDPEMRYLQNGTAVCSFSVGVTEKWGKGENAKSSTTWYKVSAWRDLAETANSYVRKGMQIQIVGKLQADENGNPRAYLNKSGQPAASFELTANSFQFLGSKGDNGAAASSDDTSAEPVAIDSGDIPF